MKKSSMAAALLLTLLLGGCAAAQGSDLARAGSAEAQTEKNTGVSSVRTVVGEELTAEQTQERAAQLIQEVFGFDVSEGYDIITDDGELNTMDFERTGVTDVCETDADNPWSFDTCWAEDGSTVRWMRRSWYSPPTEDNAVPEDYTYSAELLERARDCIQTVYGLDTENASVQGYAYKNRVAFLFRVPDGMKYHVSFDYPSMELIGVQMFDDEGSRYSFYTAQDARTIEEG